MGIKLSKEESLFRNELIFWPDLKAAKLDHTLISLFELIRHEGSKVKRSYKSEYTPDVLVNYMRQLEKEDDMSGIEEHPEIAKIWIRSNLVNLSFRGKHAKEKLTALRPLHLESFLIQNAKNKRDYFTSDQLYCMLGTKPDILECLKNYLGKGYNAKLRELQSGQQLDIDTTAILHLIKNVKVDIRHADQIRVVKPLLRKQAELFCDDVLRLLAYQDIIPRNVMMEYLKTLCGFHLTLYFFKVVDLFPKMVQAGQIEIEDDWKMIVDMSGLLQSSMSDIAVRDMERQLNQLNNFIRRSFAFNTVQNRIKNSDPKRKDDVCYLLGYLHNPPADFNPYCESCLNQLYKGFTEDEAQQKQELIDYLQYEPDCFGKYVALLVKERGNYWHKYSIDFIDTVSMKNSENALILGGRTSKNARRGTLGVKLLELLVQLLVLNPHANDGGFESRPLSITDLIQKIRKRYGLIIDGTAEEEFQDADVQTLKAFRDNVNELKNKLRQIGFYTDLSDAGTLQKINPRYQVK